MSLAEQLYNDAFQKPRTPRSEPYKHGVRAALAYSVEDGPKPSTARPAEYAPGTVEFDAWFAGLNEGYTRARHYLDHQPPAA